MSRLRQTSFVPPQIIKGVPIPTPPLRVKNHRVNESVWNSFLRQLEPGDCFVIDYQQLGGLKAAAHRLNIAIVHRTERTQLANGHFYRARCWRSA